MHFGQEYFDSVSRQIWHGAREVRERGAMFNGSRECKTSGDGGRRQVADIKFINIFLLLPRRQRTYLSATL